MRAPLPHQRPRPLARRSQVRYIAKSRSSARVLRAIAAAARECGKRETRRGSIARGLRAHCRRTTTNERRNERSGRAGEGGPPPRIGGRGNRRRPVTTKQRYNNYNTTHERTVRCFAPTAAIGPRRARAHTRTICGGGGGGSTSQEPGTRRARAHQRRRRQRVHCSLVVSV